jgi:hypothetical protein
MNQKIKDSFWLYLRAHTKPRDVFYSHPIFNGCVTIDPETNNLVDLSIDENYNRIMERIKTKVYAAENLLELFSLLRKPYLISFLDYVQEHLTDQEFSERLGVFWNLVEYPHQHGIRKLLRMWKRTTPEMVMTLRGDIKGFKSLSENITVYRGLQDKKAKVRGLSWSIDIEKAKWFANRWNKPGDVWAAEISKKDCFAYYDDEKEVVVNPYCLKNLRKI